MAQESKILQFYKKRKDESYATKLYCCDVKYLQKGLLVDSFLVDK